MSVGQGLLNRSRLLLGDEAMARLAEARVIVFGMGGVGSWTAEALARTGVGHLTIVDSDRICITNINRQAMATSKTIGQVKVDAMRQRLLDINPDADIAAVQRIFDADTADTFPLDSYDYVVDAIDSLKEKALLILRACSSKARFFSSMGAALRLDPTKVRVSEFWNIKGDPLARALRRKFKKDGPMPRRPFLCVYSEEAPKENKGHNTTCGTERCLCPKAILGPGDRRLLNHEWCSSKAQINGALAHITAIFGMTLAGLIIEDLAERS